jgi:alkanesulfonate monooxygenase SsuD/methylene tetrahydromethanopterin reductase-like flavin-dependent oxidoreductase (luciferase family)
MTDLTTSDFSLMLVTWGRKRPTVQEMVEVSQRAEKLGYYSVGVAWMTTLAESYETLADSFGEEAEGLVKGWSLIMEKYHCLEALAVVPMIAQATSTIRVGLNALVPPALHPFYVAKYLATLDVATDGRVTTAFGFGVTEGDGTSRMLEWLGSTIPAKRRGLASEEALEVITRLWTESGPLDHDGEFFRGKQMLVEPKPIQKPYPEIWWAGERKRSLKMAARYGKYVEIQGEAILWSGQRPLDRIREFYTPALDEANQEWGGSAKMAMLLGARVTEKPMTSGERAALYWFKARPERGVDEVLPVGTPEQCAEVIHDLREAGIEHFILDFCHEGYESLSFANEQIEAWATDVMPLLSGTTVSA